MKANWVNIIWVCLNNNKFTVNSLPQKTYVTSGSSVSKERISRRLRRLTDIVDKQAPSWDLTKLHNSLFSLEKELNSWNVNGTGMWYVTWFVFRLYKHSFLRRLHWVTRMIRRKSLMMYNNKNCLVEKADAYANRMPKLNVLLCIKP